jgi:hypothetical protein
MPSYHFDSYGKYKSNWCQEFSIRTLKMVDIGSIFMSSGVLGYVIALGLNKVLNYHEENYKNNFQGIFKLATEILLELGLIGILLYVTRQFVQTIPFLFDGWKGFCTPKGFKGYNHKKVREWENPYPIAFFVILFQDSLKNKIHLLTRYLKLN